MPEMYPVKITLFLPGVDRNQNVTPLPERVLRRERVLKKLISEYNPGTLFVQEFLEVSEDPQFRWLRSAEATVVSFYVDEKTDAVRLRDELVPWLIDLYDTDTFPVEIANAPLFILEKFGVS